MPTLTTLSPLSTLEEELERLKLEVWFVLIIVLTWFRAFSTLEEEFERLKLEV
jgi:hypothetical protein